MNKKITIGILILIIAIIGLVAILGSSSNEKSSDGLQTFEIEGFKFKAPSELEWSKSMAGTNGFLENDIYNFNVGIEEDMLGFDDLYGDMETINGITYKYDISGFDDKEVKTGQIMFYFKKNDTIFSIQASTETGNKEFIIKTAETIIKTMTPI